jgi:RNA polymerase sigma-70 factor, ECF subfamily
MADADGIGCSEKDFADVLRSIGLKYNFGRPAGIAAGARERTQFLRSLHLRDLALAHACARGNESAWQRFLEQFRSPLQQAAGRIAGSASAGDELADCLYAELFGLTERGGARWSPFESYSGRGSLMGWLRAILAQRHVDRLRRTHRETPLESVELPARSPAPEPAPETLRALSRALSATLPALSAEDRFLLSAWFLDGRTLLEIAGLLRVHEATVSRRIRRVTAKAHKHLLMQLEAGGMSRRAAREALGADPGDLSINLRILLQSPPAPAFFPQAPESGEEPS